MKKFFISLSLIFLAHFFTINSAYCEEDFNFFNENPSEEKANVLEEQNIQQPKDEEKTRKRKFFSKKEKKIKKFNSRTNKTETVPKGYWGQLPDISKDFEYRKQSSQNSHENNFEFSKNTDLNDENLKPAPYDDPLFIDVIVKKDKTSNYVNDLQKTKYALNNLKKCIEEQGDIQHFNACVNMVDMYSENLKNKYENKSESLKESYKDILLTNYQAKVLGNLMYNANYYARYIPTQQGQYSKENITKEKQKLLIKIDRTLFSINSEK